MRGALLLPVSKVVFILVAASGPGTEAILHCLLHQGRGIAGTLDKFVPLCLLSLVQAPCFLLCLHLNLKYCGNTFYARASSVKSAGKSTLGIIVITPEKSLSIIHKTQGSATF